MYTHVLEKLYGSQILEVAPKMVGLLLRNLFQATLLGKPDYLLYIYTYIYIFICIYLYVCVYSQYGSKNQLP